MLDDAIVEDVERSPTCDLLDAQSCVLQCNTEKDDPSATTAPRPKSDCEVTLFRLSNAFESTIHAQCLPLVSEPEEECNILWYP